MTAFHLISSDVKPLTRELVPQLAGAVTTPRGEGAPVRRRDARLAEPPPSLTQRASVVASGWLVKQEAPRERGLLQQFCSSVSYGPRGGFLPPLATKLTQSPWFLNVVPKFFQPPFMHWALLVGSGDEKLAWNARSS
jgi:hypothetical protein